MVHVEDGIVIVDGYNKERQLVKRFFTDGKNWQYYDPVNDEWDQTQDGGYYDRTTYRIKGSVPEDVTKILDADKWVIKRNDLGEMISDYTHRIAAQKRQQYNDRKYERIRMILKDSKLSKSEEKKVTKWLKEEIFQPVSILLPKNKNGKNPVRCLTCGCRRQVTGIRHKGMWTCPKCGRVTEVRSKRFIVPGRKKEREDIAYMARVPGGFAITAGTVTRLFDKDGKQRFVGDWRYVYYDGEREKKSLVWPTASWYGWKFAKYPLDGEYYLYPGNLKDVLPEGRLGAIDMTKIGNRKLSVFDLVQGNRRMAEKAYKAGLYGLIGYAARFHGSADSFQELTGIDQNYITQFRENGYGLGLVYTIRRFYQVYRRKGTYNPQQLKIMSQLDYIGEETLTTLREFMTDTKLINYFGRQMRQHPKKAPGAIIDMYIGYLEMAQLLNREGIEAIDLSTTYFRFPKDCIEAHDRMEMVCEPIMEAMEEERRQRREAERSRKIIEENCGDDPDLAHRAEQYKNIPQPRGNMIAIFPESVADLVNEGTALHHCVGWNPVYRKRQLTGEYITFFIRKKEEPEKPYFTATYKIVEGRAEFRESYGKGHEQPRKTVRAFIDAFMANVNAYNQKGATA